jgi:hypothetical protein
MEHFDTNFVFYVYLFARNRLCRYSDQMCPEEYVQIPRPGQVWLEVSVVVFSDASSNKFEWVGCVSQVIAENIVYIHE